MVKLLKRFLGIEELEKRVEKLENSQTLGNLGGVQPKPTQSLLNEWINGKEEGE